MGLISRVSSRTYRVSTQTYRFCSHTKNMKRNRSRTTNSKREKISKTDSDFGILEIQINEIRSKIPKLRIRNLKNRKSITNYANEIAMQEAKIVNFIEEQNDYTEKLNRYRDEKQKFETELQTKKENQDLQKQKILYFIQNLMLEFSKTCFSPNLNIYDAKGVKSSRNYPEMYLDLKFREIANYGDLYAIQQNVLKCKNITSLNIKTELKDCINFVVKNRYENEIKLLINNTLNNLTNEEFHKESFLTAQHKKDETILKYLNSQIEKKELSITEIKKELISINESMQRSQK